MNEREKMKFLFWILVPVLLWADTHTSASASYAACSTAVFASSDGDIIRVPPGTATWKTSLTITKSLTIIGLQTVVYDSTGTGYDEVPFFVANTTGLGVRISNFVFRGKTDGSVIYIGSSVPRWRVDHCTFDNVSGGAIRVNATTFGTIDHCYMLDIGGVGVDIASGADSIQWALPTRFGTDSMVYVENCFISRSNTYAGNAIDATSGTRYCFRYNLVDSARVENHGNCHTVGARGTLAIEIYKNTLTGTAFSGIGVMGGTARIWGNKLNGTYNYTMPLACEKACPGECPNGDCTSYPCTDQVGRGTNNNLDPVYEWNNTANGSDINFSVYAYSVACSTSSFVKANRDFYNNTQPVGYVPYMYPNPIAKSIFYKDTAFQISGTSYKIIDSMFNTTDTGTVYLQDSVSSWVTVDSSLNRYLGTKDTLISNTIPLKGRLVFKGTGLSLGINDTLLSFIVGNSHKTTVTFNR